MCFVSLYKPYLELIGYGLFFALHIIMSFGMIKNITSISKPKIFDDLLNNLEYFLKTNEILYKPFIEWLRKMPSYLSIPVGLLLLFVSLLLLLTTFSKLKAKHTSTKMPSLPGYISGGSGEAISGYTYKYQGASGANNGAGYYLNSGEGTDFYFNDKVSKQIVHDFKIMAITTTVLIWAQYLLYANYDLFNALIFTFFKGWGSSIITGLFMLFGSAIIVLSSICVSLTNQVNNRTKSSQDPVNTIASSNSSGQNAQSSAQPTTTYGQIQQMLKTTIGL